MSSHLRRFAIIDVETGGLNGATDPIFQVAVVCGELAKGDSALQHISSWSSMVRLRRPWDPIGAQHIHHIPRRKLLFAPTVAQVLERLFSTIESREVVAHNFAFDWKFISTAAHQHNLQLPTGPHLCTLKLSRQLDPDRQRSHRLTDICERYGIEIAHAHDAHHDAMATAQILPLLLRDQRCE
ncbi:MAG: 3'-5' exonuclease [Actinobacteria bacterium]|nr:3'-5' exonuclease [Actinomycetota bacterium]